MQLLSYYLELRGGFEQGIEGQPIRITLDELAARLFCTTRNVKLLLKKMSEQGWITWSPGRGRGNASELTFQRSAEDMITKQAMELANQGDYKGTIELIHQLGKGAEGLQDSFIEWLFSYFGYRAVENEERCTDSLRFPVFNWIASLDPAHTFYALECHMISQLFDTLVLYDSRSRRIDPHLAHHWEASDDQLSWTFYLRKGVMFHHGRQMTASDVVFTFQRLKELGPLSSQNWLVEGIESIEMVNLHTVRFQLKYPNVLFLRQLSIMSMSIVPEDICRDHEELFGRMPIGTGAFRVERHDNYICKIRAFENYFAVRPHLDQVEIWFLPKDLSGSIPNFDLAQQLCDLTNMEHSIDPQQADSEWMLVEKKMLGCGLLTFNMKKPGPQQHSNFRRAVDLLIDRERMVNEMGGTRKSAAKSFIPGGGTRREDPGYDFQEARRLLEEMNYKGEPVRLFIYQNHAEDAKWIQKQCLKAGLQIEIVLQSNSDMVRLEHIGEADMILYQVCMESDYSMHIIQTLRQNNSYIRAHMKKELADAIDHRIIELQADSDEHTRIRKLEQIVDGLVEEKAFLFILHRSLQTTYHKSVQGVSVNELGWVDFRKLWISPNTLINESKTAKDQACLQKNKRPSQAVYF